MIGPAGALRVLLVSELGGVSGGSGGYSHRPKGAKSAKAPVEAAPTRREASWVPGVLRSVDWATGNTHDTLPPSFPSFRHPFPETPVTRTPPCPNPRRFAAPKKTPHVAPSSAHRTHLRQLFRSSDLPVVCTCSSSLFIRTGTERCTHS